MTARDAVYGRKGGRWADADAGSDRAESLHKARLAAIAQGYDTHANGSQVPYWPDESLQMWAAIEKMARSHRGKRSRTFERAIETMDAARAAGRVAL